MGSQQRLREGDLTGQQGERKKDKKKAEVATVTSLLSPLTFWLVLDQLLHLALLQCVNHVGQAALTPLRGAQGAHGRAPASTSSSAPLLLAR